MASGVSLVRVLVVLGVVVAVTAAVYLLAGWSVGAWLADAGVRTPRPGAGSIGAWGRPLLALPAIAVACVAMRVARGVRAERRRTREA